MWPSCSCATSDGPTRFCNGKAHGSGGPIVPVRGKVVCVVVAFDYSGYAAEEKAGCCELSCVPDGIRFASLAKAAGADVMQFYDRPLAESLAFPRRERVLAELFILGHDLGANDALVFYFAGHGTHKRDDYEEQLCFVEPNGEPNFLVDEDVATLLVRDFHPSTRILFVTDCRHSGTVCDLARADLTGRPLCHLSVTHTTRGNDGGLRPGAGTTALLHTLSVMAVGKTRERSVVDVFNSWQQNVSAEQNGQDVALDRPVDSDPDAFPWPLMPPAGWSVERALKRNGLLERLAAGQCQVDLSPPERRAAPAMPLLREPLGEVQLPADWELKIAGLVKQFPQMPREVVVAALISSKGHAGVAVPILQAHMNAALQADQLQLAAVAAKALMAQQQPAPGLPTALQLPGSPVGVRAQSLPTAEGPREVARPRSLSPQMPSAGTHLTGSSAKLSAQQPNHAGSNVLLPCGPPPQSPSAAGGPAEHPGAVRRPLLSPEGSVAVPCQPPLGAVAVPGSPVLFPHAAPMLEPSSQAIACTPVALPRSPGSLAFAAQMSSCSAASLPRGPMLVPAGRPVRLSSVGSPRGQRGRAAPVPGVAVPQTLVPEFVVGPPWPGAAVHAPMSARAPSVRSSSTGSLQFGGRYSSRMRRQYCHIPVENILPLYSPSNLPSSFVHVPLKEVEQTKANLQARVEECAKQLEVQQEELKKLKAGKAHARAFPEPETHSSIEASSVSFADSSVTDAPPETAPEPTESRGGALSTPRTPMPSKAPFVTPPPQEEPMAEPKPGLTSSSRHGSVPPPPVTSRSTLPTRGPHGGRLYAFPSARDVQQSAASLARSSTARYGAARPGSPRASTPVAPSQARQCRDCGVQAFEEVLLTPRAATSLQWGGGPPVVMSARPHYGGISLTQAMHGGLSSLPPSQNSATCSPPCAVPEISTPVVPAQSARIPAQAMKTCLNVNAVAGYVPTPPPAGVGRCNVLGGGPAWRGQERHKHPRPSSTGKVSA